MEAAGSSETALVFRDFFLCVFSQKMPECAKEGGRRKKSFVPVPKSDRIRRSMPVSTSFDHEAKTIHTTASGIVSCDEILDHVERKRLATAFSYAEVFDARGVTLDLSISDLHTIAAEVRAATGQEKPGRVSVVTNSSFIRGLAHTYAALTIGENPEFRVFQDLEAAKEWTFAREN